MQKCSALWGVNAGPLFPSDKGASTLFFGDGGERYHAVEDFYGLRSVQSLSQRRPCHFCCAGATFRVREERGLPAPRFKWPPPTPTPPAHLAARPGVQQID